MRTELEGKVTYERTSDTGDPSYDFDYKVGYTTVPSLKDLMSSYEGTNVKLTIIIEEQEQDSE